jgi:hypothetical protein
MESIAAIVSLALVEQTITDWIKLYGPISAVASTVTGGVSAAVAWAVWRKVSKSMDGRYTQLAHCEAMRAELVTKDAQFHSDLSSVRESVAGIEADMAEVKATMRELGGKLDGFFALADIVIPRGKK